jgi:hypothetical protein
MRGPRSIKKGSLSLKGNSPPRILSLSFILLERCHLLYLSCWTIVFTR